MIKIINNKQKQITRWNVAAGLSYNLEWLKDNSYIPRHPNSFIISDSLSEFKGLLKPIKASCTLSAKDKIFISSESGYPATLLSKYKASNPPINIPLTRILDPKKADKIIMSQRSLSFVDSSYYEYIGEKDGILIIIEFSNLNTDIAADKIKLENHFGCSFYYGIKIDDPETVELYINNKNKVVFTSDLIKFVQPYLPRITDSEIEAIFAMVKSSDKALRDTGIQLIPYYNCSKALFKIIRAISKVPSHCIPNPSACSASWKWLYAMLNASPGAAFRNFDTCYNNYISFITNNPINEMTTEEIREELKVVILNRINNDPHVSELKEDLKKIGMEFAIHDTNRTTDISNRELEEGEV